ncbi:MAG: nucleoside hydrolase [[Clostridium] symbiosum]
MKMILDVDTGIDDALAIAYALGSEEAQLIGVTCCFGNVTVDKAVQNTLRVLRLFGAGEIPVYAGAPEMFTGKEFVPNEVCKRVHGLNGIGEIELPEADKGDGRKRCRSLYGGDGTKSMAKSLLS